MEYRLECECGWATQCTESEIVEVGQAHGREVHGFEPTPEQIRALAKPVERG
jgi:hypothetical protein